MRLFVMIALALLALTGCATIMHGTKQTVSFTSDPSGATVNVGGLTATTPTVLSLSRSRDYTAQFSKAGYDTQTMSLGRTGDHWIAASLGNIWNYIVPGLIVDALAGGLYEFDPPTVNATLTEKTK